MKRFHILTFMKEEFEAFEVPLCKDFEFFRRMNEWWIRIFGLACGLIRNLIPSLLFGWKIQRADNCAFSNQREDFCGAQFCRLFNQPFKTIPLWYCLSDSDLQADPPRFGNLVHNLQYDFML